MKKLIGSVSGFGLIALLGCNGGNPAPGLHAPSQPPAPPATSSPNSATDSGNTVAETFRLAPYRVTCLNGYQTSCLVALDANGNPLEQISEIQGFEFQWGHRYMIDANVAPTGQLTLNRVVMDEPVPPGTSITMPIDRQDVSQDSASGADAGCQFRTTAGASFSTATGSVCQQLRTQLSRAEVPHEGWLATFQFTGNTDQPLQLISLRIENVLDWSLIRVTDIVALQPNTNCRESIFELQRSGGFALRTCTGAIVSQGNLSAQDASSLNAKLAATLNTRLSIRACLGGVNGSVSNQGVYLSTRAGGTYSLQQTTPQALCYRGDEASAQALATFLSDLRNRYAPGTPTVADETGPHPVPGHIIRPGRNRFVKPHGQ